MLLKMFWKNTQQIVRGALFVGGALLVLTPAQAADYSAYESYAQLSNNNDGQTEGLFLIQYDPIAPAVVGFSGATQYSRVRGALSGGVLDNFEYVAFAKEFMAQHKSMLNVNSGHDFTLIKDNEDSRGGHHLRFFRTYRDIRLDNMEVIVHFNPKRQITGINGEIVRLDTAVKAAVDQHLASGSQHADTADLRAAIANSENLPVSEVEIRKPMMLIRKQAPHVIWELVAVLDNNIIDNYTYRLSDAKSPLILSKSSNIRH